MSYTFPDGIVTNKVFIRKDVTEPASNPDGSFLFTNNVGELVIKDAIGGTININTTVATLGDHNNLANLAVGDVHTQYALLSGRSIGQTINGGTSSGGNLTLSSTSNNSKGSVIINDTLQANNATANNITIGGSLTVTNVSGFKATGNIDMDGNKISNIATPTDANDAVNLGYVNGALVANAQNIGTTASGTVAIGNTVRSISVSGSTILVGHDSGTTITRINGGTTTGTAYVGNSTGGVVLNGEVSITNINGNNNISTNINAGTNNSTVKIGGGGNNQIIDIKSNDNFAVGTVNIMTDNSNTSGPKYVNIGSNSANSVVQIDGSSVVIKNLVAPSDVNDAVRLYDINNKTSFGKNTDPTNIYGSSIRIGEYAAISAPVPISIGSGGQTGTVTIGGGVNQSIYLRGVVLINHDSASKETYINTGDCISDVFIGGGKSKTIYLGGDGNSSATTWQNVNICSNATSSSLSNQINIGRNDISTSINLVGGVVINGAGSSRFTGIGAGTGNVDIKSSGTGTVTLSNPSASVEIPYDMRARNDNHVLNKRFFTSEDAHVESSKFFITALNIKIGSTHTTSTTKVIQIGESSATGPDVDISIGSGNHNGTVIIGGGAPSSQLVYLRGKDILMPNITAGTGATLVLDGSGYVKKVTSNRDSKNAIRDIKYDSTDVVKMLEPKSFSFKANGEESIGLIAEDTFNILPEICPVDKDGKPFSIRYDLLSIILLAEVKKLRAEIDEIKNKIM